jgi:hypothetical protein
MSNGLRYLFTAISIPIWVTWLEKRVNLAEIGKAASEPLSAKLVSGPLYICNEKVSLIAPIIDVFISFNSV